MSTFIGGTELSRGKAVEPPTLRPEGLVGVALRLLFGLMGLCRLSSRADGVGGVLASLTAGGPSIAGGVASGGAGSERPFGLSVACESRRGRLWLRCREGCAGARGGPVPPAVLGTAAAAAAPVCVTMVGEEVICLGYFGRCRRVDGPGDGRAGT